MRERTKVSSRYRCPTEFVGLASILAALVALATSPAVTAQAQERGASPSGEPYTFARAWLEAFNSRDVDRILTFYAEDALYEDVPVVTNGWGEPSRGHAMIRESLAEGFEALPDLSFEFVSASGVGSRMAVEWIMTGTHLGDYPGLPATGRSISIRGVTLIELEGREIASSRDYYDAYLFLRQLGAVPALDAAGASAERTAASPEENKAMVRRVVEEGVNTGDLDVIRESLAPDYARHSQATVGMPEIRGVEQMLTFLEAHFRAFPDWREEIELIVAEGDKVAYLTVGTGTHTGPMGDVPPTGKRVEVDNFIVQRFEDGKIAETWVGWDNLSVLEQLGLYPPSGADSTARIAVPGASQLSQTVPRP